MSICPHCSSPIRSVRSNFCVACGKPLTRPETVATAAPQSAAPDSLVASPPTPRPVVTPQPAQQSITPSHWNWGALLLGPWWAIGQRAYLAAAIYLLMDGALWFFAWMVMRSVMQDGSVTSNIALFLIIGAVVFLMSALLAIPLAVRGDAIALRHRTFEDTDRYRSIQRAWARWGAAVAVASVLLPTLSVGLLINSAHHSPDGLNMRLLTASTQGNVAEIRAVLNENRETFGISATNLNFDNAIANARFSNNAEAVKVLQEEVAKRRQLEGMTNQ